MNFRDKQATKRLNFLVSTLIPKSNGFQNRDTRIFSDSLIIAKLLRDIIYYGQSVSGRFATACLTGAAWAARRKPE